jgi:hypothetical protein
MTQTLPQVDSSQPHALAKPDCLQFLLLLRRKNKMKVVCDGKEIEVIDLTHAMAVAKSLGRFVSITGDGFEIVGVFGVDSVQYGRCPDGVAYDWNKASRIGRVQRERT